MTTPSASSAAPSELPESSDAGLPSQGVRTTVNLLLFVHLFSLGVMFLFNGSEMGLRQQLRRVPGYYLQLLGMDLDFDSGQRVNWELQARDRLMLPEERELTVKARMSALREHLLQARDGRIHEAEMDLTVLIDKQKQNPRDMSRRGLYQLTFADPLDWAHFLEFRYQRDGQERVLGIPAFQRTGTRHAAVAGLPSTIGWHAFWPRQRYVRYQMLTREVARLAGLENVQDILPAAITEALLKSEGIQLDELGARSPALACRRLEPPSTLQVVSVREGQADPWVADPWDAHWFHTVYQKTPVAVAGGILFNDSGGLQRDYSPKVSEESPAPKSRL